jgi:hypothetical protein
MIKSLAPPLPQSKAPIQYYRDLYRKIISHTCPFVQAGITQIAQMKTGCIFFCAIWVICAICVICGKKIPPVKLAES